MTDDSTTQVRVVFRKWPGGDGVIALFPELPADPFGVFCESYAPVGQHAAADYHAVIRHTTPATPGEAASLTAELYRIGYRLVRLRRASHLHHERRLEEARRYRTASRSA